MILDNRVKKQAAFYMLVKFVDENNGSITVNTDKVKRVFNDENDYCTSTVNAVAVRDVQYSVCNAGMTKT